MDRTLPTGMCSQQTAMVLNNYTIIRLPTSRNIIILRTLLCIYSYMWCRYPPADLGYDQRAFSRSFFFVCYYLCCLSISFYLRILSFLPMYIYVCK